MAFALFGIFASLVAVGFVWHHASEKKRTETLRGIAARLGLDFAPLDVTGLQGGFVGFNLFSQGRARVIKNIAYGRVDDAEVMLFDYSYTTGSGKNRHTRTQTVGFFQSDRLTMPEFVARPERLFDKIGQVFGYQDIDLPMHPDFSKRFILRGVDESAIREFFAMDVARFFEANPGLSVEAKLDRFILFRTAKRLDPEQWGDAIKRGQTALTVFLGRRR